MLRDEKNAVGVGSGFAGRSPFMIQRSFLFFLCFIFLNFANVVSRDTTLKTEIMNRICNYILCLACFVWASSLSVYAKAAEKGREKFPGGVYEGKGDFLTDAPDGMYEEEGLDPRRDFDVRICNLCLELTAGTALLLIIVSYSDLKRYREIWFRNNVPVKSISERLHDREELHLVRDINVALRQQVRALNEKLETLQAGKGGLSIVGAEGGTGKDAGKTSGIMEAQADDERYGRGLYERMERLIIDRQLYLDPGFNGERARNLIHIPRNRFVPFIKRHTGGRFLKYLNKFRLCHAARLLKEKPGYSIKAVASESGIPTLCTFHRLFLEEFGVTPAEYRERMKQNDNQGDKANAVRN